MLKQIFLLICLFSFFARLDAQIAELYCGQDVYLPDSWSEPSISVSQDGKLIVMPPVPSFKKNRLGSVISVNRAAAQKIEAVPVIERISFLGYEEFKNQFKFTEISDEDGVGKSVLKAEIQAGDKPYSANFTIGDKIKLGNDQFKIMEVQRNSNKAADETSPEKEAQHDESPIILLQSDGGKMLFAQLNKNIFPRFLKVKFRDKYNKGVFYAICPGKISINDTDGRYVEQYNIIGIDGNMIVISDSMNKTYRIQRSPAGG